jgi:hypothetical protein
VAGQYLRRPWRRRDAGPDHRTHRPRTCVLGRPAAELVSLAFCGDTDPDSDLVAGYIEAGGSLDFSPALRHRLVLYHLCLGLLLVAACGPRGYGRTTWSRRLRACRPEPP